MRKLKFRVWSNLKKSWLNSIIFGADTGVPLIHYVEIDDNQSVIHKIFTLEGFDPIIQQYIGIKDINGKEIYEGDIIRCGVFKPAEVFYDANVGGFYPFYLIPDEERSVYATNPEVVGNILENSDLLK